MACRRGPQTVSLVGLLALAIGPGCLQSPDVAGNRDDGHEKHSQHAPDAVRAGGLDVPSEHRAGVLPLGAKMPIRIPIANRSGSAVRIVFSAADCGCLSEVENLVLAAGDHGELELLLAATREGPIRRKVLYEVSGLPDVDKLPISLVGECRGELVVPASIGLGTVRPGQLHQAEFNLAESEKLGWSFRSVRQIAGPSAGKIIESPEDSGRLQVLVEIPATSGDGLLWRYELEFEERGGTRVCSATVSVGCAVTNGVFEANSLYLGVVKSSSPQGIERKFKLVDSNVDVDNFEFTADSDVELSIERSADGSNVVTVRLAIDGKAATGMRKATLRCPSESGDEQDPVEIPVNWMILP